MEKQIFQTALVILSGSLSEVPISVHEHIRFQIHQSSIAQYPEHDRWPAEASAGPTPVSLRASGIIYQRNRYYLQ